MPTAHGITVHSFDRTGLAGVDLTLRAGHRVGLVGPRNPGARRIARMVARKALTHERRLQRRLTSDEWAVAPLRRPHAAAHPEQHRARPPHRPGRWPACHGRPADPVCRRRHVHDGRPDLGDRSQRGGQVIAAASVASTPAGRGIPRSTRRAVPAGTHRFRGAASGSPVLRRRDRGGVDGIRADVLRLDAPGRPAFGRAGAAKGGWVTPQSPTHPVVMPWWVSPRRGRPCGPHR